jgi:predicted transcriptional regulator
MGARSKIIDLNRSSTETEEPAEFATAGETAAESDTLPPYQELIHESLNQEWADDYDWQPRRNWAAMSVMTALGLAFAAWSAFFIWTHLAELTPAISAARIAELIVQWSVPTALIALGWLLAMRLSSREAARFGEVARLLREESSSLEERMRRVNGEIALARSFLAENARELESVGRTSAKRLTDAAQTLSTALNETDERAQTLQTVSDAAVTNLEQLRNHLPVVTSAAKDATNQIGIVGNSAHSQIQTILAALNRMSEASAKTGGDLGKLEQQLADASGELETRISSSAEKLAAAVQLSQAAAMPMFAELARHIDDVEKRIGDAAAQTGAQISDNEQRLGALLLSLQANIEALQTTLGSHEDAAQDSIVRLSGFIEETRATLETIDAEATDRIAKLAFAVNALVDTNGDLSTKLSDNRAATEQFTGESASLLEILQQIETEAAQKLPQALGALQSKFTDSRSALKDIVSAIGTADENSALMGDKIAQLDRLIDAQRDRVSILSDDAGAYLEGHKAQIEGLSAALALAEQQIKDMVALANENLVSSMQRVRETTREAADASRQIIDGELSEISGSISERNALALKEAAEFQVKALDETMRTALQRNLSFAQEIEQQTASQIAKLNEMAGSLEQRIAQAQSNFAGIDDEGFARRMALLTESLNSAAIDVAKILSNDVTDTAWAAYLKGDRGVFTRRAVKLLDNSEVKIIATAYDDDAEFRENVNRYIHDFEAMMRVLLSTRDGNAVGVTLLSSDVGKLYVALAQAIERLRG